MGSVSEEFRLIWEYIRTVLKYWWLLIVGLGLTLLDFAERLLGTWWIIPPMLRLGVGTACAAIAQYLAYRDLSKG